MRKRSVIDWVARRVQVGAVIYHGRGGTHHNISNGARFTCYGVQSLYTQTYKRESALHVMVCPFSAMIVI